MRSGWKVRHRLTRRLGMAASGALLLASLLAPPAAHAAVLNEDLCAGAPLSAGAVPRSAAPDVQFAAGVLTDSTGHTLWARQPDQKRAMASITKVMTALLALEKGSLDETVTVPLAATKVEYASGLLAGEQLTVRQLLELALVASSNDAAYTLGMHVGSTMPAFVDRMNARAQQLELTQTHFTNPHGLDQSGHHSSAADLEKLARTALTHPEYRRIISMRSVSLPAYKTRGAARLAATDELLGRYPGLQGGKTGFTDDAKYSFVASAERDGVTLTAVVLGAGTNPERFRQCAKLLDWGFDHVELREIASATRTIDAIALAPNRARTVEVRFAETTAVPVFDLEGPVTTQTALPEVADLPVFKGQQLGEVSFLQGKRVLARVPTVAAHSVASAEETVGSVPVSEYLDRSVIARAADGEDIEVPKYDPSRPVTRRVSLHPKVEAPVVPGAELGEIVYSQGASVIVRVPVVAAQSVPEPGVVAKVGTWFARGWRAITGQPTMASPVVTGA